MHEKNNILPNLLYPFELKNAIAINFICFKNGDLLVFFTMLNQTFTSVYKLTCEVSSSETTRKAQEKVRNRTDMFSMAGSPNY